MPKLLEETEMAERKKGQSKRQPELLRGPEVRPNVELGGVIAGAYSDAYSDGPPYSDAYSDAGSRYGFLRRPNPLWIVTILFRARRPFSREAIVQRLRDQKRIPLEGELTDAAAYGIVNVMLAHLTKLDLVKVSGKEKDAILSLTKAGRIIVGWTQAYPSRRGPRGPIRRRATRGRTSRRSP